jgi:hypothetical protein
MTEPTTRAERRAALRASTSRVLTPGFRRYAYGVAAAAVVAAVAAGWLPAGTLTVAAPLLMAVFYVDEKGEPRA